MRTLCSETAPAEEQEVADTMLAHQMAGDERAQTAGGAGDQHRASAVDHRTCPLRLLPTSGSGEARHQGRPLTQGDLRLRGCQGEGSRHRFFGGLSAVGVEQDEAAGMLGLGRVDQAPDRRRGRIRGLLRCHRRRTPGDQRQAVLYLGFIGENRLERRQGILNRLAGDRGARPVPSDLAWQNLDLRRQDILRAKGIIDVKDNNRRLVFQAVHMILEGDLQREWREGEPRYSRMVFIGRNLDRTELAAGFEACAA